MASNEGWHGWDEYAPFYDWENAQTLGRRDVVFWTRVARQARGRTLELGCGTGRVSLPLVRAGVRLVGIDRSEAMLTHALKRARRLDTSSRPPRTKRLHLARGDIRWLPFASASFNLVIAPYGILQSLLRDRDVRDTLASVARVLKPGGTFGLDLVPDVPQWKEYSNRIQMSGRGPRGTHVTLVESVRQDRRRRLTMFEQEYRVRRGHEVTRHPFSLTFRTIPMASMARRLERTGFAIRSVLGDYRGGPWDDRADVWIILAQKV
ncbi:MAG: class I SAM-dependent methyltransferase [Acidimicrobiia bacterium]|nr:class I SAM-dependent methyltransferase [Acidimicrobiia bacterium]